jgi:hypothetical protein
LARELDVLKFSFYLFLDVYKLRFLTHEWAFSSFFTELVQASLMEPMLALDAFPWVDQNSLAKGTEELAHLLLLT